MTSRSRRLLLIALLIPCAVVLFGVLHTVWIKNWTAASILKNPDRIELLFHSEVQSDPDYVISDPAEVRAIVSLIELASKQECKCAHDQAMRFYRKGQCAHASICDHCFDVRYGGRTARYKMPPALWLEFTRIQAEHGKKTEKAD